MQEAFWHDKVHSEIIEQKMAFTIKTANDGQSSTTSGENYTAAGNMHAPDKARCLQWMKELWECIMTEIVKKSFRTCSISVMSTVLKTTKSTA